MLQDVLIFLGRVKTSASVKLSVSSEPCPWHWRVYAHLSHCSASLCFHLLSSIILPHFTKELWPFTFFNTLQKDVSLSFLGPF